MNQSNLTISEFFLLQLEISSELFTVLTGLKPLLKKLHLSSFQRNLKAFFSNLKSSIFLLSKINNLFLFVTRQVNSTILMIKLLKLTKWLNKASKMIVVEDHQRSVVLTKKKLLPFLSEWGHWRNESRTAMTRITMTSQRSTTAKIVTWWWWD